MNSGRRSGRTRISPETPSDGRSGSSASGSPAWRPAARRGDCWWGSSACWAVPVGRLAVEGGDVGLDLFHEVEEVAEAGLVALLALADPADEAGGEPVGARGGLVDALVDAAHPALGDLGDDAVLDEPLDVVVDALLGLVQAGGDLGARARLGQLPQYLDALRFEQRLGLLDALQVQEVSHHKNHPVRTKCFCQLIGGGCSACLAAGRASPPTLTGRGRQAVANFLTRRRSSIPSLGASPLVRVSLRVGACVRSPRFWLDGWLYGAARRLPRL